MKKKTEEKQIEGKNICCNSKQQLLKILELCEPSNIIELTDVVKKKKGKKVIVDESDSKIIRKPQKNNGYIILNSFYSKFSTHAQGVKSNEAWQFIKNNDKEMESVLIDISEESFLQKNNPNYSSKEIYDYFLQLYLIRTSQDSDTLIMPPENYKVLKDVTRIVKFIDKLINIVTFIYTERKQNSDIELKKLILKYYNQNK